MVETVRAYIAKHDLLRKDESYLVALSGGADSVAMLRALLELGYDVKCAHCNFHLRGKESDRDEKFVTKLCSKLGVELFVQHFDTKEYANMHKISIEMAARELRYDYFARLRERTGCAGICVAHHRDDSVETVLLNLIRGTGLEGLKGISPRNGRILRPMLNVNRYQLTSYLNDLDQDYTVDSSNFQADVQRNKVRIKIMPELLEINPAASSNIARSSDRVAEALKLFDYAVEVSIFRCRAAENSLSIEKLKTEPSPSTTLWYYLKDKGFNPTQVDEIVKNLDAETGKKWVSDTHVALINRVELVVEQTDETFEPVVIDKVTTYQLPNGQKLHVEKKNISGEFAVSKFPDHCTLDTATFAMPLKIRRYHKGDRFVPYGMTGERLLSDFMTDRKLSVIQKLRQLVVEDANGNIVWVVGIRPDNRNCVSDKTKEVLVLTME